MPKSFTLHRATAVKSWVQPSLGEPSQKKRSLHDEHWSVGKEQPWSRPHFSSWAYA